MNSLVAPRRVPGHARRAGMRDIHAVDRDTGPVRTHDVDRFLGVVHAPAVAPVRRSSGVVPMFSHTCLTILCCVAWAAPAAAGSRVEAAQVERTTGPANSAAAPAMPDGHPLEVASAAALPAPPAPPAPAPAGQAEAQSPVSAAETLLFLSNHLRQVHAPATLRYAFHKAGSIEKGFDDKVELRFLTGKRAPILLFLSGARRRPMTEIDDPEGNPVLLAFLERDIAEMGRLTGGASNYFRKRIRVALAEAAPPHACRVSFAGKSVAASEVSIEPYRNDPRPDRLGPYLSKRYTFILSDKIPGGIYRLRAAVPAPPAQVSKTGAAPPPPAQESKTAAAAPAKVADCAAVKQPVSALIDETLTLIGTDQRQR